MKLWEVPNEGGEFGQGYVVMAESADEARRLVLAYRRAQFDDYYDGSGGQRDRSGQVAQNWNAAAWDREMWRRWYYFGVRRKWTEHDNPDDEIGEASLLDGSVFGVPVLGYSW